MREELGKWLIIAGLLVFMAGVIVYFLGDRLGWLGNLPGDIRIERENVRFYFPITTMILASILLSILFTVISRLFRD